MVTVFLGQTIDLIESPCHHAHFGDSPSRSISRRSQGVWGGFIASNIFHFLELNEKPGEDVLSTVCMRLCERVRQ